MTKNEILMMQTLRGCLFNLAQVQILSDGGDIEDENIDRVVKEAKDNSMIGIVRNTIRKVEESA